MGTADEVAKVVRVTTAALAQDRYLGRGIPYVKHGKRVLYRWDDVRAYLDANRIDPGAA
ncbi:MAG: DNA-binding protein [Gordonia sp. (in: high G+C Gram-positive bacteria)]|nr:MAG: DNA-binding protein [Gordonia sp. (in: high G+C Gram-positive bacteria)]